MAHDEHGSDAVEAILRKLIICGSSAELWENAPLVELLCGKPARVE